MKIYELREGGYTYLKDLLEGGDELARAFQREDLANGRLFTFLPDAIDPERVSLVQGGLGHVDWDEEFSRSISVFIKKYLKMPGTILTLELKSIPRQLAANLYLRDPYQIFFSANSRHSLIDSEGQPVRDVVGVYGYVTHLHKGKTDVEQLIGDRRPFGAIGALTTFDNQCVPKLTGADLGTEVFTELAQRADYILASAFDDEGWIVWARSLPKEIRLDGFWNGGDLPRTPLNASL